MNYGRYLKLIKLLQIADYWLIITVKQNLEEIHFHHLISSLSDIDNLEVAPMAEDGNLK